MKTEDTNTLADFRSFLILILIAISLCLTGKTFAYTTVLPNIGPDVESCCNTEILTVDMVVGENLHLDVEEEYFVKDWMLNASDENWTFNTSTSFTDEEILLEEWMVDASNGFWKNVVPTNYEEEIVLEDWMLDASLWK